QNLQIKSQNLIMLDENENSNENAVVEEVAVPSIEPQVESQPESVPENIPDTPTPKIPPAASAESSVEPKENEPKLESVGGSIPPVEPQTTSAPLPTPLSSADQRNSFIRDLLTKANKALRERKIKKLEKIVELAKWNDTIVNDDIEKMLHVSDATATRYLNELVKQNKLVRLGHPKHAKYKLL
ncbi:MAG: hypothetical protein AAB863_02705, partial [Patescibacteria group bacterium]